MYNTQERSSYEQSHDEGIVPICAEIKTCLTERNTIKPAVASESTRALKGEQQSYNAVSVTPKNIPDEIY